MSRNIFKTYSYIQKKTQNPIHALKINTYPASASGGVGVGGGVGTPFLQVAMHSPGDSEPFGSSLHWPTVVLQLYMTGAGAGVGFTLQAGAKVVAELSGMN